MVIIQEIEINNCFSIEKLFLRFENDNFVTIFNCGDSNPFKDKLILAIRPFLLKEFSRTRFENNPGVSKILSNVRIRFIIPKGKFKHNTSVDAMRTAGNPNYVYYYFNGEQYIDEFRVFHERCRIDVTHLFPCLNQVFSNDRNNLMSIWVKNECPNLEADSEKSYELLANFLQVCHLRAESELDHIAKLTNSILAIDKHTDRLERRTFVDVANSIGKIFSYITYDKYAIQFCIPLSGQDVRIDDIKWEDLDLASAETFVLNLNGKTSALWNTVEPGLRYLLKIAQLIALAKNLGQHCIILKDTTVLQNYQNEEMVKEAIIEDSGTNTGANWKNKDFLGRIVNICHDMEIMLFMNYHGGLPLPPENANIIKYRNPNQFNRNEAIFISRGQESMRLEQIMRLIIPRSIEAETAASA